MCAAPAPDQTPRNSASSEAGRTVWGREQWGAPCRAGNSGWHSGGAGNGGEHTGVPLTVLRQVLLLNFRALVEVPEACRSSRTGPHVAAVAPST